MNFHSLPPALKAHLRQKEVSIKPISVQKGSERFRELRARSTPATNRVPRVKKWRLNLLGLSQVSNLLFVAYDDKIHVYRPDFPQQSLSDNPVIILSPPRTPEGTANIGYVDRSNPHSINNLFIDFLGNLEVLLLACDDGDVIGYYTSDVQKSMDRRDESDGPDEVEGFDVRPFFHQNLSMSAWGLSIHTNSRKIAVSANTAQVTVFPFGLSATLTSEKGRYVSETESLEEQDSITLRNPRIRDVDQKFILAPMTHNVPSVAFCNTDDDPTGQLLVSGEILGSIYIWDLHTLSITELLRAEYCYARDPNQCFCDRMDPPTYPHAVWGLSWLDRKAFRKFKAYAPPLEKQEFYAHYWDAEKIGLQVPDTAFSYELCSTSPKKNGQPEDLLCDRINFENSKWLEDMTRYKNPWVGSDNNDFHRLPDRQIFKLLEKAPQTPSLTIEERFRCPLLINSRRNTCLLQPYDTTFLNRPAVVMRSVFHQSLPVAPELSYRREDLEVSDRLSLQTHIPELGLVIIGSPVGRAAVFSLGQAEWRPRRQPTYFHRLDRILPLASQEARGERPEVRLVGVAASPVQGQMERTDYEVARKWRLFLYYQDHSVLTYELSRTIR